MVIRPVVVTDAPKVLDYMKQVQGETDNLVRDKDTPLPTLEQECAYIENILVSRGTLLIAECDDKIVGMGQLSISDRDRICHQATLAITVLQSYWGQQIGSNLMQALIAHARKNEIELITLEVRSDNERAIALYRRFNFEIFGHLEDYFKIDGQYYSADYMKLKLN